MSSEKKRQSGWMEDKHIWYFLFYAYNKEKGKSFSYLSEVLWHKPMTEESCESCSLKYPTWELAIIKSRSRCKFQSSPRRSATCSLGPDAVQVILCITLAETLLAHNSLLYSNGKESKHQAHLFCIISCLWYSQILLYPSSVENMAAFFNQWWDRTFWCFKGNIVLRRNVLENVTLVLSCFYKTFSSWLIAYYFDSTKWRSWYREFIWREKPKGDFVCVKYSDTRVTNMARRPALKRIQNLFYYGKQPAKLQPCLAVQYK